MQKSNRILSFLLALVMVLTILPATVFAEGETDVLEGWSITLGDNIGVKFYLDSADYTVTATVNGEAVTPAISGNVATVNVAAAQMTDPIVLTVKDADQVVHTGKYSVRQYADTILKGSYDDKVKDMVKQMLNYGAASQTYFNHNIENLTNSGITAPEITMPSETPAVSLTDSLAGINFYGASLLYRNKIAVRFYFQVTGDINSFAFSQGKPVLKDDMYYIEIDGINPQNYADDITLTINDGALSVTYSPLTYMVRKYNHAESSDVLKALVQAMYGYHLEAVEYRNYLESEHADGHIWLDATCIEPKTCSICGEKEGTVSDHNYVEGVCSVCGIPQVIRTEWDMSNAKNAADWTGYHSKVKNEALTTTVSEAGMAVEYLAPGNGWKGIILEKTAIDISKLTGKLTFTYSTDMEITDYRIHIVTGLGGGLIKNGTADCYTNVSIADITEGSLEVWTQTANEDGSVTVTFNLSSMGYFANGAELRGLTIVTVTANDTPGTVTYKSIELEKIPEGYNCQTNGHIMKDATCTEPKTCTVCGDTEGEPLGHTWVDATCTEPKICSVCDITDDEPLGHAWVDATCTAPKTCSACGTTEGTAAGHTFVEGVCSACGATEAALATPVVWDMSQQADASQWYCAQAYTEVRPSRTYSEITEAGFTAHYGHKNAWKGIILKNAEIDITNLSGLLSFTYHTENLDITEYRIHILTDQGGDLESNESGTPSHYYVAVAIGKIAGSNAWTRTENADGSITVTLDLTTLPFYKEGTVLMGMDIVTVATSTTGEWRSITYKTISIS